MQYVACKFRIADTRTYTWAWDGEPLAEGDQVKVADNRSDGWKRVYVVSISDDEPPFACKPILGKVEPEGDALADGDDRDFEASRSDPLKSPLAF